jgi:hypothetical protein
MGITLKNNARTTLTSAITSLATTIYVDDTSSFPELDTGDYFYCTIESTSGAYEIVKVTQINATNFIVVRGQEDTIAVPFVAGARVELRITVQNLTDFLLTGSNVSDEAFGVSWNGDDEDAPSRNALYDKFVSLAQADISGLTTSSSPLFAGLNLPSGGVINFDAGDVTITHSSDLLTVAGGNVTFGGADANVVSFYRSGAAAKTRWIETTGTNAWGVRNNANTLTFDYNGTDLITVSTIGLTTFQNDIALATGTDQYIYYDGALHLYKNGTGEGVVINSDRSVSFYGAPKPSANDATALGASGTAWSDLFLASGAVINFDAGDVTITHVANLLAFAGASIGYSFDAAVSITAGTLTAWGGTFILGKYNHPLGTDIQLHYDNTTGYGRILWQKNNVTKWRMLSSASSDNFSLINDVFGATAFSISGSANTFSFYGAALPSANDAAALGASGTAWADLFLASGGVINFNAGDVTLTHSADTLTVAGGNVVFGGADVNANVVRFYRSGSAAKALWVETSGNNAWGIRNNTNTLTFDYNGTDLITVSSIGFTTFQNDIALATGTDQYLYFDNILHLYSNGVGEAVIINANRSLSVYGPYAEVQGTYPMFQWYDTDGGANEKYWRAIANGTTWELQTVNDAYNAAAVAIYVTRSGNTPTAFYSNVPATFSYDNVTTFNRAATPYLQALSIGGAVKGYIGADTNKAYILYDSGGTERFSYNNSTGAVTLSGLSFNFNAVVQPSANDAAALGASGTAWSDLFLASGAVINFNAGDVTLTHSTNLLTFNNAESGYVFAATSTYATLTLERAQSHGSGAYMGVLSFGGRDSGANYLSGGYVSMYCRDATDASEDTEFRLAIDVAGAQTERLVLDGNGLSPATNDVGSLGVSGTAWSDLFLANGAVINFNAGGFTITHSVGTGLTFYGGGIESIGSITAHNDITLVTGTDQYLYYDGAMHITKNGTGDAIGIDSSRNITTYGSFTFGGPANLKSYTVAGLPAGTTGDMAYASNGTGVLVFKDGSAWCACDTGAAVAA